MSIEDTQFIALSGPNYSINEVAINPSTLKKLDLTDGQVVELSGFHGIYPLRVKGSEGCPPDSLVIPKWVLNRIGLYEGEKVSIKPLKELNKLDRIKLRVLGSFQTWLKERKKLIDQPVFLDQNIPLGKDVNVLVLDYEPWSPNAAGLINRDTIVETQYSGLYNYIVVVDQSRLMLDRWRGVSKYKIARAYFRKKAQYKIRRAATISILTLSDEPMIYINWMRLQMDLRMVFQTILTRIFENITPLPEMDPPNYTSLMKFLDKHMEGLDRRYPTLITILSAREFDYGEKESVLRLYGELDKKYGPYLRFIGIPIGPTFGGRYTTLRELTKASGGTFVEVRSPNELISKTEAVANIIDFKAERMGDWLW